MSMKDDNDELNIQDVSDEYIEQAYRKYLNSDAPDLWNRIETGINSPDTNQSNIYQLNTKQANTNQANTNQTNTNKTRKNMKGLIISLSSLAAALLILVLCVPVLLLSNKKDASESDMQSGSQFANDSNMENNINEITEEGSKEAVDEYEQEATTDNEVANDEISSIVTSDEIGSVLKVTIKEFTNNDISYFTVDSVVSGNYSITDSEVAFTVEDTTDIVIKEGNKYTVEVVGKDADGNLIIEFR